LQETVVEKFIFVLEVTCKCISNLSRNHTLQLTTSVAKESLQLHSQRHDAIQWFSCRCSVVTIYLQGKKKNRYFTPSEKKKQSDEWM